MQNLETVTGTVTRFQPSWAKIYPDVKTVKVIENMGDFSFMVKPEDSLGISLTIPKETAVKLAQSLSANHLNIAIGSTVEVEYQQINGYVLHKIIKLNGRPFKYVQPVPKRDVQQSNVDSQFAQSQTPSSVAPSSSSSQSGIEEGFKALFDSSSSDSSSSQSIAGSKSTFSSTTSASVQPSSVRASSAESMSYKPSSMSSASSVNTDMNSSSAPSSTAMNPSEPKRNSFSRTDSPEANRSDSLINQKLDKVSKYHSILESDGNYKKTSAMYDSLAHVPATDLNPGLHKVFAQEGWDKFTQSLWTHANIDFNRTLNQRITDARMNYAVQCNSIPGGVEVHKKPKPKPKKQHLTDKNVF